ncbi:MAG: hypothetical protein AAGF83_19075 [Cyanobacteria bacterium P01_G01_bin.67]
MFTFNPTAKSLLGVAVAASTTAIAFLAPAKAETNNISKLLVETANMMNKSLPMMVDQDTRWDSSFAGPGKMLSYKYTLINYSASQIDSVQFANNIRTPLTDTICNNPATQIFPENGVLLNFNYYDNARNLIARVNVAPGDCK